LSGRWSLSLNIFLFLTLLPGLVGIVVTTYMSLQRERLAAHQDLLSRVRSMSQLVDEQILQVRVGLELVAATSHEIETGDFEALHKKLLEAQRKLPATNALFFYEPSGQMLLSTLKPFGSPLPVSSTAHRLHQVVQSGQPQITSIVKGTITNEYVILIDVPIVRDGRVIYILSANLLCEQINRLLTGQIFPKGWIAVIYDATGTIAGRTLDADSLIGKKVAPTVLEWLDGPQERIGEGKTLEGRLSVAAMHRSAQTGYSVTASVPDAILMAPLRTAQIINLLIIGGSLVLGMLMTWRFAQSLRQSIRALEVATQAVAAGAADIELTDSGSPELNRLSRRFQDMFVALRQSQDASKAYQLQLEIAATHDPLTALANRLLIQDRIAQAVLMSHRSMRSTAVLLLDLDHFKNVNDTLTHLVGDALLMEVARRLNSQTRQSDTVGRLGGDEFVVVMTDIGTDEEAARRASKILAEIDRPFMVSGHALSVTASIGVTLAPRDGQTAAELIKNADIAMYRAKESGRNGYEFFSSEMNARVQKRLQLEEGLRKAIERQEFELYYQPRCDLNTGRIVGAEALIRWRHPSLGLVSPAAFIPVAEETGLIEPIGEWVLQSACTTVHRWHTLGYNNLMVSVNVAARQFQSGKLHEVVAKHLSATGMTPELLELELTESDVMKNPENTLRMLGQIKALGVGIALDDFGTGYSSLSYLKRFPVDCLKIDQSFIRDITIDDEDAAIAQMVVALGHNLKQVVVAEGVETQGQLAFLKAHRCDQMQGYLFSPPVPAHEFEAILVSGKRLAV